MNRVLYLAVILAAAGFIGIAAAGINLASYRVGPGLLIIGVGCFLLSLGSLLKPLEGVVGKGRAWLVCLSCLGASYFFWRAITSGPVALALADIVLVITFLAVYLTVTLSGQRRLGILIAALVLLCTGNIAVALVQQFSAEGFSVWETSVNRGKVVTGLFTHYNYFTGFMNGSMFFWLSYLCLGRKVSLRALSAILVIMTLAVIFLGGSRGGWVSLMVGGAVWLCVVLTYLKQKESNAFGLALILGFVVAVIGVTSSFWWVQKITDDRVGIINKDTGEQISIKMTDGDRLAYQQLAFEIFQDSPVIGMGPRAYSYLSLEKWDTDKLKVSASPPDLAHNEYLQALSDYGLIGLVIVLLLVLVHIILGIFSAVSNDDSKDGLSVLQIGAMGGLAAMLSQCFFSFLLHTPSCMAMIAFLIGILACHGAAGRSHDHASLFTRFAGGFGVIVSVSLLIVGSGLTKAFLLLRDAERQLAIAYGEEEVFQGLDTMLEAGEAGRDPGIFERAGRVAMAGAATAIGEGAPEGAEKFNQVAKTAFERALHFNPHFAAALSGLPRVEAALGNWEESEAAYKKAMEKLWARENRRRLYFHASRSSYAAAIRALNEGDRAEALENFREGLRRISKRREILQALRELPEDQTLQVDLESWIAFMEARLLFKKADEVWKNARPRNPERAYALMLEARKRYQASEVVVREKNANWERQVKHLEFCIGSLKGGRVQPAKLTQAEISAIIGSQAGLDSSKATR